MPGSVLRVPPAIQVDMIFSLFNANDGALVSRVYASFEAPVTTDLRSVWLKQQKFMLFLFFNQETLDLGVIRARFF